LRAGHEIKRQDRDDHSEDEAADSTGDPARDRGGGPGVLTLYRAELGEHQRQVHDHPDHVHHDRRHRPEQQRFSRP